LDADGEDLGEWPLREKPGAINVKQVWPAVVEFTRYGGIHRIDGRSTGLLPETFPTMGIGAPAKYAEHGKLPDNTEKPTG
jgi:hypothetical protein